MLIKTDVLIGPYGVCGRGLIPACAGSSTDGLIVKVLSINCICPSNNNIRGLCQLDSTIASAATHFCVFRNMSGGCKCRLIHQKRNLKTEASVADTECTVVYWIVA